VGGKFTMAGGISAPNIASWDGTSWHSLGAAACDATVTCMKAGMVFGMPLLIVAGEFGAVEGFVSPHIAAWSATGWFPGMPGIAAGATTRSVETHDDGPGPAVYVGGLIGTIGLVAKYVPGTGVVPVGTNGPTIGGYQPHVNKLKSLDLGTGPALYVGGLW